MSFAVAVVIDETTLKEEDHLPQADKTCSRGTQPRYTAPDSRDA